MPPSPHPHHGERVDERLCRCCSGRCPAVQSVFRGLGDRQRRRTAQIRRRSRASIGHGAGFEDGNRGLDPSEDSGCKPTAARIGRSDQMTLAPAHARDDGRDLEGMGGRARNRCRIHRVERDRQRVADSCRHRPPLGSVGATLPTMRSWSTPRLPAPIGASGDADPVLPRRFGTREASWVYLSARR